MKVFSEESALQLSEMLLQNDKDIKDELEAKINAFSITFSRNQDSDGVIVTVTDENITESFVVYDNSNINNITMVKAIL